MIGIYGVCISDIYNLNEEKAICFLNELAQLGYPDYLETFTESKENSSKNYTFNDWSYNFSHNGYFGLSAFLKEIIGGKSTKGFHVCINISLSSGY